MASRSANSVADAFAASGVAMCATGVGSLINVHATKGPVQHVADLADADDQLKELFFFAMLDAAIYLARRGFVALRLEVADDDVDRFLDAAREFRPLPE